MKIYKKRGYRGKYSVKISVRPYLKYRLKTLEYLLRYIRQNPIRKPDRYRSKILEFLRATKGKNNNLKMPGINLRECPKLAKDPELSRAFLSRILELLNIKNPAKLKDTSKINVKNYLRSYLITDYYLAKALEAVMPKTKAVEYYKRLVDNHTRKIKKFPRIKQVSDLISKSTPRNSIFAHAFNYAQFELDKGRVGTKITRCKWNEVLKEVKDRDYAYTVACHYDFEAVKKYNSHFRLTRTQTLTQGKKHCDFVWHDRRLSRKLIHPPRSFWEKLK
ncbi:L-2-amino-thiazoline-4-carboxylic acid hydrolase [Elusimicrobiota bacterium]